MPTARTPVVADRALARLAAYETRQVPGVARLHPTAGQATRTAVQRVGRRATAERAPLADVERDGGRCTVTVRISAGLRPPVLDTVGAVQQRVAGALARIAGVGTTVQVLVLDVEPDDRPPPG